MQSVYRNLKIYLLSALLFCVSESEEENIFMCLISPLTTFSHLFSSQLQQHKKRRRMEIIRQITGYETWYISIFFSFLSLKIIQNNHCAAMKIADAAALFYFLCMLELRDAGLDPLIRSNFSIAIFYSAASLSLIVTPSAINAMIATSSSKKNEFRCCF